MLIRSRDEGRKGSSNQGKEGVMQQDNPPPEIRACTLRRSQILMFQEGQTPDYVKTMTGCFVRVRADENSFKIARIVELMDRNGDSASEHDHVYYHRQGMQLDDGTQRTLDDISDEQVTEFEIQNWLMSLLKRRTDIPSVEELSRKVADVKSALSWPLTPSKDYQMDWSNECSPSPFDKGRGEEEELYGEVSSADLTNTNTMEEATEKIEVEEIANDTEEDNTEMEEEEWSIGGQEEFEGEDGTDEGLQPQEEEDDEEGGVKEEDVDEGQEQPVEVTNFVIPQVGLDEPPHMAELLQNFLRRSQIVDLLQQPDFAKRVTGSFVRFFYHVPAEDEDQSGEKKQKKYKIVQIVGIRPSEKPYETFPLIIKDELELEWEQTIVYSKVNSLSDAIPTEEEFAEWIRNRDEAEANASTAAKDVEGEKGEEEEGKEGQQKRRPRRECRDKVQAINQPRNAPKQRKKEAKLEGKSGNGLQPPRKKTQGKSARKTTEQKEHQTGFKILKNAPKKGKVAIAEEGAQKTRQKQQKFASTSRTATTAPNSSSLTEWDRKVLGKNGFSEEVSIRISRKNFSRLRQSLLSSKQKSVPVTGVGTKASSTMNASTSQECSEEGQNSSAPFIENKLESSSQMNGEVSASGAKTVRKKMLCIYEPAIQLPRPIMEQSAEQASGGGGGATVEVKEGGPISMSALEEKKQADMESI